MSTGEVQRAYTFNQWVFAVSLAGIVGPIFFVSLLAICAVILGQSIQDMFPTILGSLLSGVIVGLVVAWMVLSWPMYHLMRRPLGKKRAASWGAILGGVLPLIVVLSMQFPRWLQAVIENDENKFFFGGKFTQNGGLLTESGWILVFQISLLFTCAGGLSGLFIQWMGGTGQNPKRV